MCFGTDCVCLMCSIPEWPWTILETTFLNGLEYASAHCVQGAVHSVYPGQTSWTLGSSVLRSPLSQAENQGQHASWQTGLVWQSHQVEDKHISSGSTAVPAEGGPRALGALCPVHGYWSQLQASLQDNHELSQDVWGIRMFHWQNTHGPKSPYLWDLVDVGSPQTQRNSPCPREECKIWHLKVLMYLDTEINAYQIIRGKLS